MVQTDTTGTLRASFIDDNNTVELKNASGIYTKIPASYSTDAEVDISAFLQQNNISKVLGIRLVSDTSSGGEPARLYRLNINGLEYEKGDRGTGETIE